VFGCKDYIVQSNNVKYCKCKNEQELLHKFLDFWKILDPDIITGWNCELFDMPYLYNRITNVLSKEDANSLSHWNYVSEKEINQKYGKGIVKNILGATILDYMVLYKKYSNTPQENYRLNTVASHELDVGKIDYTGSLTDLYKTDYQKFIDYNIRDVELINMLDDKLKFIELTCAVAYDAKVNYIDTMTTVKPWDIIVHNYLMDRCIVVPQFTKKTTDEAFFIPKQQK
jgi:DNA polymerase elongation subunit (family B)